MVKLATLLVDGFGKCHQLIYRYLIGGYTNFDVYITNFMETN